MSTTPNLPVPAGATAGSWSEPDCDGDQARTLTWSRHDTDEVGVTIEGWQSSDGDVDRCISIYDAGNAELSAADARRLAAALLNAADELDRLR
jgi:hypothetical protein